LIAWIITKLSTQSIRELTRAARKIASGEFDYTISVNTRDESEQLARAFNEMRLKIKNMIETISSDRAELATILEYMTDGIIMTDNEGNITLVNSACIKILNTGSVDIINKPLIEAFRDHKLDDLLKQSLKTGRQQVVQFESNSLKKYIQAIAIPINGDELKGA
jgi:signal transduction histidine kinase